MANVTLAGIGTAELTVVSPDSSLYEFWFVRLFWNLIGYASVVLPCYLLGKHLRSSGYFDRVTSTSSTQQLDLVDLEIGGTPLTTQGSNSRAGHGTLLYRILRFFFLGSPESSILPTTATPAAEQQSSTGHGASKPPPAPSGPDFSNPSQVMYLIVCAIGLEGSYLCWGVLQEKIMTTNYKSPLANIPDGLFKDSQFLVWANRISAFVLAVSYIKICSRSQPLHKAPAYKYAFASLSNILSSWCQYEALKFISFPTQVLGKASKIIPVMLMGKLVSGQSYPLHEYFTAGLLSTGIGLFLFSRGKEGSVGQVTTFSGVVLMCGYLFFDSFTSNWQGKLFSQYKMSSFQMMAGVTFFSSTFTVVSEIEQGSLGQGFTFMLTYPRFLFDMCLMSLCSAFGQIFIFTTISNFGVVTFVILMTIRQALAIFLSCLIFGHVIQTEGIFGILLVFIALALRIYLSQRDRAAKKAAAARG